MIKDKIKNNSYLGYIKMKFVSINKTKEKNITKEIKNS